MKNLGNFLSVWQNLLAVVFVSIFVVTAIAAPLLAPPDDPDDPSPYKRVSASSTTPQPPDEGMPLGSSPNGYDIYHSLIWGTRSALRLGLTVTLVTAIFGIMLGAFSGLIGGWFNRLVLRVTDAFLAFPAIGGVFLFQQILITIRGPGSDPSTLQKLLTTMNMDAVMLALILFSWMPYTRIINAGVTVLKKTEFILSARVVGATNFRIVLRHLLPNGISPAIVMAARDVGAMVILEAAFTFMGIGGNSPWGVLLASGRNWIIGPGGNPLTYWWAFVPVTIALVLFSVCWNLLGDRLNVALNPYLTDV